MKQAENRALLVVCFMLLCWLSSDCTALYPRAGTLFDLLLNMGEIRISGQKWERNSLFDFLYLLRPLSLFSV
jgi:hypothetical protein